MPQSRGVSNECDRRTIHLIDDSRRGTTMAKESSPTEHQGAGNTELPREQQRVRLEEEAGNLPGVREVMEVFQLWQRADQSLDGYRSALRQAETAITTDHANAL